MVADQLAVAGDEADRAGSVHGAIALAMLESGRLAGMPLCMRALHLLLLLSSFVCMYRHPDASVVQGVLRAGQEQHVPRERQGQQGRGEEARGQSTGTDMATFSSLERHKHHSHR